MDANEPTSTNRPAYRYRCGCRGTESRCPLHHDGEIVPEPTSTADLLTGLQGCCREGIAIMPASTVHKIIARLEEADEAEAVLADIVTANGHPTDLKKLAKKYLRGRTPRIIAILEHSQRQLLEVEADRDSLRKRLAYQLAERPADEGAVAAERAAIIAIIEKRAEELRRDSLRCASFAASQLERIAALFLGIPAPPAKRAEGTT